MSPSDRVAILEAVKRRSILGKTKQRERLANAGFLCRRFVMGETDYVPTVAGAVAVGLNPDEYK